eukprot:Opistho-2@46891
MSGAGPVVIVTGASRGIGKAATLRLAQLGARLVINGVNEDNLRKLSNELGDSNEHVCVAGDVADLAVCKRIVEATIAKFGRIDALVNNAGILGDVKKIIESDPREFARTLEVNVNGPFYLTQAALPELRKSKGRIINVSSGAATKAYVAWGAYCVSKAGLNMLTECVAAEEPDVIAVSLRPGIVETDMQGEVRSKGTGNMDAGTHQYLSNAYATGTLVQPSVPGEVIARMSVDAALGKEWSGRFFSYDDADVLSYLKQFAQ